MMNNLLKAKSDVQKEENEEKQDKLLAKRGKTVLTRVEVPI
jgi:hypothetical protein